MEKVRYFKLKDSVVGWKHLNIGQPYRADYRKSPIHYSILESTENYPEDWEECDEHGNPLSSSIESLRGAIQPLFVVVELLNLIKEAPDAKKALIDKAITNANEIDLDKIKKLLWTV